MDNKNSIYQRVYRKRLRLPSQIRVVTVPVELNIAGFKIKGDIPTNSVNLIEEKTPVGLLYAENKDGKILFGFSAVNTKAGDKFEIKKGLEIASDPKNLFDYAEICCMAQFNKVPASIHRGFGDFAERAQRYFKDSSL